MNKLSRVLFILTVSLVTSCTHVVYNDSVWCASPNLAAGGTCEHFLTKEQSQLNSQQYIEWLVGSDANDKDGPKICTSAATFAKWKANLEKECSNHKDCIFNSQSVDSTSNMLDIPKPNK